MKPPKPCLERRCPRDAVPGGSRCEEHAKTQARQARQEGRRSPGTTGAWRKARKAALRRAGHRCERCGRTDAQARQAGTHLEVHHPDGRGVGAPEHDPDQLVVLCRTPCHVLTFRDGVSADPCDGFN